MSERFKVIQPVDEQLPHRLFIRLILSLGSGMFSPATFPCQAHNLS